MSEMRSFLFKHLIIISIVFSQLVEMSVAVLSDEDKKLLFTNCKIFDNPSEYSGEICGSDGVTYSNSVFLECLNHEKSKNVSVGTMHQGKCRDGAEYCKENLLYSPVCGTDNKTWSNIESLICHNHMHSTDLAVKKQGVCEKIDYCKDDGFEMYGKNPVCASNGHTYQNVAQVYCLQQSNNEITITHDGGCKTNFVYKLYGSGPELCSKVKDRYESNPLCASDNITYLNPFEFLCKKPDLKVITHHVCGTTSHNACVLAHTNTTLVEGEYLNPDFTTEDEVCGSDGQTYKSAHHLDCHTIDNKYLYKKHTKACVGPDDNPCGSVPEESHRFPVCGSDDVTYVSPEAIWCAKRRYPDKNLRYRHDGTCHI